MRETCCQSNQSQTVKTVDKMFKNVSNYKGKSHVPRVLNPSHLTGSKLLKIVIKRLLENQDDIPVCRKKTEQVIFAH